MGWLPGVHDAFLERFPQERARKNKKLGTPLETNDRGRTYYPTF